MADLEKVLAELHETITAELLKKVKAGTASSADLSVARQLLKDNNITAVPVKGSPLGDLNDNLGDLPSFEDDDNVVQLGG